MYEHRYRNWLRMLVILGVVQGFLYPNVSRCEDSRPNALTRGSAAVIFGLSEGLTLSSVDGMTVAIKYVYSQTRALRVGVTVGSTDELKHNDRFAVIQLFHLHCDRDLSPYWGVGPAIEYAGRSEDDELAFGADFLIGAEWFPVSRCGIFAEYSTGFAYRTLDSKESNSFSRKSRSFEVTSDGARWGISLYW